MFRAVSSRRFACQRRAFCHRRSKQASFFKCPLPTVGWALWAGRVNPLRRLGFASGAITPPPPGGILGVGDLKWLFARENSLGRPGPGPKPAPGWGCACCGAQSACPLPLVGTEKPGPKASDGCLRWVPPVHAYGGDAPGLGWGGGSPPPTEIEMPNRPLRKIPAFKGAMRSLAGQSSRCAAPGPAAERKGNKCGFTKVCHFFQKKCSEVFPMSFFVRKWDAERGKRRQRWCSILSRHTRCGERLGAESDPNKTYPSYRPIAIHITFN